MTLTRHLVIFTRHPRLGTGKRRLAEGIGPVQALRVQRIMLALTIRRLGGDPRWTAWLAVTPDRSGPWSPVLDTVPQGSGDLGRRMAVVARNLPPGPVVIVGSDIPGMRAGHIARAFCELGRRDAVFGPAADGGYWLVGLRRRPHFINPFDCVRWSSKYALSDTLANLIGKNVGMLDTLSDVDNKADLARHLDCGLFHSRSHYRIYSEW
jgi:uncharacterized protein